MRSLAHGLAECFFRVQAGAEGPDEPISISVSSSVWRRTTGAHQCGDGVL